MSIRKRKFSHRHVLIINLTVLLAALLSCGGNDESGPPVSDRYLSVSIEEPKDAALTNETHVFLWGSVSTEEHYSYDNCPIQQNASIVVTWKNTASGAEGSVSPFWQQDCLEFLGMPIYCYCFQFWWAGAISLTTGANVIEATASRETQRATTANTVTRGLNAPQNFAATRGPGQATLSWYSVPGATSYNLYWSLSSTVSVDTGTKIEGVTSPYTHTGLADDGTYYYLVTAVSGNYEGPPSVRLESAPGAPMTLFAFASPAVNGTINESDKTILVYVPAGTDATALIANFTILGQYVTVGSTVQVSGVTPNDFTNPVTYTVHKADGSTQNYTVTVTVGVLETRWARTVTAGSDYSVYNSVSVASDGSLYAVGGIYGTGIHQFGNGVTAAGQYSGLNMLVVKYDSTGAAQWARTAMGATCFSEFNSVSAASDGSVYAAGDFVGDCYFGNSVSAHPSNGSANILLVKYNSAGVAQWARTAAGNISELNSVSVASDGSVYAAGYMYPGDCDFGNGVIAAGQYNGLNIVLVKYNSNGVAQWARTATAGNNASAFKSVSVAPDGSVYSAGYMAGAGTYDFGNSVVASGANNYNNIVLVKYDSSGLAQWARTMTAAGSGSSWFSGVFAAADGSVYAVGSISGTETYGFGNSVTAAGVHSNNSVLVKYDSSGLAQWTRTVTAGTGASSSFYSVSLAPDGSVCAAGYIDGYGSYNFGNSVTAAASSSYGANVVLVRYTSSGTAQQAKTVTAGRDYSLYYNVSVMPDGSVYAAGVNRGTGTYNFGNSVTAAGTSAGLNALLVKYELY